jgi:hypothetical protein
LGKANGINRQLCERFLKMTKDLLALVVHHMDYNG